MESPGRLLIVDDSRMERMLLESIFTKKGFEVVTVESGEDCLAHLEDGIEFDTILLDYVMKGISGLETLKKIREKHTSLELPILMITAKTGSDDIVETLTAGANDYITKPVDVEVAVSRVQTQLTLARLSKQAAQAKELHAINAMITTYNHEINNPLTIAMGTLEIYKRKGGEDELGKVKESLERIADIVKKIEKVSRENIEFDEYVNSSKLLKIHGS